MRNAQAVLAISFLMYAGMVFFGVFHHEPWRDEAHAWLSAREDSIGQMIESIKYAPTPLGWQFFLVPFARTGFPYMTMNILHAMLAIVAVGLLLFFGRIPIFIKILFIFSYYMAYEYAVIARHYVLTILFLFCIATLYSKRRTRPLLYSLCIALLFQTNIYSFVPALMIGMQFIIELLKQQKLTLQRLVALGIIVVTGVSTFIMYLPDRTATTSTLVPISKNQITVLLVNSITANIYSKIEALQQPFIPAIIVCLTIIVFSTFFLLLLPKKKIFLMSVVTFGWLLYLHLFLQSGTLRHHGLFLVFLIFFLWIQGSSGITRRYEIILERILYGLLSLLLLVSIVSTTYVYAMDFQHNFSGARDMAMYIYEHNLFQNDIVVYAATDTEAILPYFDKKFFWYPQFSKLTRYHINDDRASLIGYLSIEDIENSALTKFLNISHVLFLMSQPIDTVGSRFVLLHASKTYPFWGNDTEQFWLYKYVP